MEKGFSILIGDANGADRVIQQYLHIRHYQNVESLLLFRGNFPKQR